MKKILEELKNLSNYFDALGDYNIAKNIDKILIKFASYTPKERFWAKVKKIPNGCWLWTGARNTSGYGIVTINGKNYSAHKLSWEWANGKSVPKGMVVLHSTCDTPLCVNFNHLTVGSQINNIEDRVKKNRSARGKNNGRARLTEKDVKKIRRLRNKGWTEGQIAKFFGIGRSTVSNILHNRTWRWAEFKNKFIKIANKLNLEEKQRMNRYNPHNTEKHIRVKTRNIGKINNYDIWLVDGAKIRQDLDIDFVMGGNPGRYKYVPENEIWIEQTIEKKEWPVTILHELEECKLMKEKHETYEEAHDDANEEIFDIEEKLEI